MAAWFFSGTFMRDGTPIAIEARTEFARDECLRKGLAPVEKDSRKKTSVKAAKAVRSKKK